MAVETMTGRSELERLGTGNIAPDHLDALAARCLGVSHAVVGEVAVAPVDYPTDTIATAALDRVRGRALVPNGRSREFSIFVKQLRSARLWPSIEVVPEQLRERWGNEFPWRIEIDAYQRSMTSVLPAGFRLAELYEIVEVDPDRSVIWMEDVQVDPDRPWTEDDYRRAAYGLGALAGRRPIGSATALGIASNHSPGLALKEYAHGRIAHSAIPAIQNDNTWVARRLDDRIHKDLRTRLRAATSGLEEMLARLDRLPQAFAHGDASPQNLLIPVDEPDTFVVIDWGFNSPQAVGFDLGQLLLGLANNDALLPDEMRRLEPLLIDAYTDGLTDAGYAATRDQVREGYALSAVIRSMFTALGLDEGPADETWTDAHRDNRVAMTQHLLDLCEEYL